jgi:hypothetical protein
MPILCACPNGHSLRVKDKLAGKRGKCPTCGADFDVPVLEAPPTEGGPPPEPVPTAPALEATATGTADPAIEWRMARPGGEQFGPTVPAIFAQWIAAGRVAPDTLVWRTGWPDWRRADAPNADLPAPLPQADISTPPPIPGVTLPPALPPAPVVEPPKPTIKPSRPIPPTAAYSLRKRQQAKRRRLITITLAIVCVVLAGMLAYMMSGSDPASEAKSPAAAPPAPVADVPAPQESAPEATP